MRREAVQLDALTLEVCTQLEGLFAKKQLELRLELSAVRVIGDADRIRQVLHNLLSNALRHTAIGSITVRVALEHQHGLLTVIDSGEGIDSADLPHVFERFYRADKSRSRDNDPSLGIGVGLTIAKHLLEAMGGDIAVHSQRGVGTTVRVRLPVSP